MSYCLEGCDTCMARFEQMSMRMKILALQSKNHEQH